MTDCSKRGQYAPKPPCCDEFGRIRLSSSKKKDLREKPRVKSHLRDRLKALNFHVLLFFNFSVKLYKYYIKCLHQQEEDSCVTLRDYRAILQVKRNNYGLKEEEKKMIANLSFFLLLLHSWCLRLD